ncbi:MAG TPA: type II secretion system protein [Gemmataceae bacterium]|nr:type II secretion system protein [Gemmataceae bacterium]
MILESRTRRYAFTLTELLVVILIIGIMVALTAGAVVRFIGVQESNNTETLIRKVHTVLQSQWSTVVQQAKREPLTQTALSMSMDNSGIPNERLARVIHIKLRLRQEFPMTYKEIFTPVAAEYPPPQSYLAPLRQNTAVWQALQKGTWQTQRSESAACLLMALERARGGQALNAADLGTTAVQDTDGDGIPEIVDAWGTPLQFIRFPTGFEELNPGGQEQNGLNDSSDPEGLLTTANWQPAARNNFITYVHKLPQPGQAKSFKLFPLIVSSGPNKALGLDLVNNPGFVTNVNEANDNMSNVTLARDFARGQ